MLERDTALSRGRFKGQRKSRVTFAKVRNDQSFISVRTDFSLMESCGDSAPNYQTKSLWSINYTEPECAREHVLNMPEQATLCICVCHVGVHMVFSIISAHSDVIPSKRCHSDLFA